MKKRIMFVMMVMLCLPFFCSADKYLPKVYVETLKGERMDIREVLKDSVPVIITFWSTTCKPCMQELDALTEVYEQWEQEFGVKVVAVSVDDSRMASRVKAIVAGRGWPFLIVLDKNQDLKRGMNVNSIPHLFLVNDEGEIVYTHTGYTPGSELEVYEKLKEIFRPKPRLYQGKEKETQEKKVK
ncbi:TlpA disulfide reductase family protein [Butyricimonas sp. Marseille-P3923]|uniref:TlpA family protein disulfide reductase n=1 Tax=Butyricimonas sp. Marseille-P3923 TaxID=1987504 RepID=UPI00159BB997|nr:TlpA disulfide reductase family protein [Butyricimonas sp. Marseille-P3923]